MLIERPEEKAHRVGNRVALRRQRLFKSCVSGPVRTVDEYAACAVTCTHSRISVHPVDDCLLNTFTGHGACTLVVAAPANALGRDFFLECGEGLLQSVPVCALMLSEALKQAQFYKAEKWRAAFHLHIALRLRSVVNVQPLCALAFAAAPKQQQGEGVALAAAEREAVVAMRVAGISLLRGSAGVAGPAV
ncbi:uncharacterized protein EMH_0071380 [Eimeria mitis]|uniref:Uncharacterized protein n=1 Tax=Eimeria mitis TaxID=44415 RepID=U6K2N3_9EIME|nr:uncharacterized protein EMH_0071380 [Eimeria mitis]CDJ31980.1 hypothetical protein EMH_0071380 [Eimeria mitis]